MSADRSAPASDRATRPAADGLPAAIVAEVTPPATFDVVETTEEAARLELAPLFVRDSIARYLDSEGLGSGPIEVSRLGEGHSNVTFLVRRGDERLVLRRPPRPPFPPSTHDVLREARVLRALEGAYVRTPRVLASCADEALLGVPFYVMEYVEGFVLVDELPDVLAGAEERRAIALDLVDALAELHAVDWRAVGLEDFGRPSGYLERQVRRFSKLWEDTRTRDLPRMDAVTEWLGRRLPESPPATIVHGDYRLGNAIFAPRAPARVAAVLDWEMATIGDPLADLGYLAATYAEPGDAPNPMGSLSRVTASGGFPSREELFERYEEQTGRPAGDQRWYQTLALWKSAVFLEGSYRRLLAGTTDDPFFRTLDRGVPQLVDAAYEMIAADRPSG